MRITVKRLPANNEAPPVFEPILTTIDALKERGRNEIDQSFTNRVMVSANVVYEQPILPGDIVKVIAHDERVGKVRSTNITVKRGQVAMKLNIEADA